MELKPQQLTDHLSQTLLPIYMVSGEEPFQIDEALQLLRRRAFDLGHQERQSYHAERSFDWSLLLSETTNLSLFSQKKLIELNIPSGKPGTVGSKALVEYCQNLPEDVVLLIRAGKIEKNALKSKWVQSISQAGAHLRVWPLKANELVAWVQACLQIEGLQAERATAEYIASRAEGNMLAAAQEIEKLALLQLSAEGSAQADVWMEDQNKFTVFDLVDAILAGSRGKVVHVLKQLQAQSLAPNLVLWGLAELVRALSYNAPGADRSANAAHNAFTYSKRDALRMQARKYKPAQLEALLAKCAETDQMIKGRASGEPWQGFTQIALKLAR